MRSDILLLFLFLGAVRKIWIKNKICCKPRQTLKKVEEKENNFITELALSQNVTLITGSPLRVYKNGKTAPLSQNPADPPFPYMFSRETTGRQVRGLDGTICHT